MEILSSVLINALAQRPAISCLFKSRLKPAYLLEGISSLQTWSLGPAISAADELGGLLGGEAGDKGLNLLVSLKAVLITF